MSIPFHLQQRTQRAQVEQSWCYEYQISVYSLNEVWISRDAVAMPGVPTIGSYIRIWSQLSGCCNCLIVQHPNGRKAFPFGSSGADRLPSAGTALKGRPLTAPRRTHTGSRIDSPSGKSAGRPLGPAGRGAPKVYRND